MTTFRFAHLLLLCLQALPVRVSAVDSSLKFASQYDREKFELEKFELVGGVNASLETFGAYTLFANGECGGILISKNRVLTSAHCVASGHPDTVRIGATNRTSGTEVAVRCAKTHPLYVWPSYQYDVAILKLETDIITVETPTLNSFLDYPRFAGQGLVVAGLGRNSTAGNVAEQLEQLVYEFVSEDECKDIYGNEVTRGLHVCAYGFNEGTCFGDTGGPLFDDVEPRWLVGIATGARGGCADTFTPDVYANVASFRDWIEAQDTDETCDDECQGCLCPAYEFMGRVGARMRHSVNTFFNL